MPGDGGGGAGGEAGSGLKILRHSTQAPEGSYVAPIMERSERTITGPATREGGLGLPDVHSRTRRGHGGNALSSTGTGGTYGKGKNTLLGGSRGGAGFRPVTAPGSGSMANLAQKRRPVTYQKKLEPYRDLGVDCAHATSEMVDWAHAHETDVNVQQCAADSERAITDLRLQSGSLHECIRGRVGATFSLSRTTFCTQKALPNWRHPCAYGPRNQSDTPRELAHSSPRYFCSH
jgi:hypothetical protein